MRFENGGLKFDRLSKRVYRASNVSFTNEVKAQRVEQIRRTRFAFERGPVSFNRAPKLGMGCVPETRLTIRLGIWAGAEFCLEGSRRGAIGRKSQAYRGDRDQE